MNEAFLNPVPMTKSTIAQTIGISEPTLYRKLKKENIKTSSGLIYPSELYAILKIFYPERMIKHLRDMD